MKALVIQELGHLAVDDRDLPLQRPNYVRVKTATVAVNPSTLTLVQILILQLILGKLML